MRNTRHFVSMEQAAEILGVRIVDIHALVQSGRLVPMTLEGEPMFPHSHVEWLKGKSLPRHKADEYVRIGRAAQMVGLASEKIVDLVQSGKLPSVQLPRREDERPLDGKSHVLAVNIEVLKQLISKGKVSRGKAQKDKDVGPLLSG